MKRKDLRKEIVKVLEGKKKKEKFYPIIFLCKDDLRSVFEGNQRALKVIDEMSDDEMEYFFKKFVDCLESSYFWDDLKTCFEDRYL